MLGDFHIALERIAMARVVSNDYEDTMRRIRRWYCKEFLVPLNLVADISDEELIVEYYEHNFENLEPEERIAKMKQLVLNPEEVKELQRASEDYDNKLLEEMRVQYEELKKKNKSLNTKIEDKDEEFKSKPIKEIAKEPDISISFDETPEDMSGWD